MLCHHMGRSSMQTETRVKQQAWPWLASLAPAGSYLLTVIYISPVCLGLFCLSEIKIPRLPQITNGQRLGSHGVQRSSHASRNLAATQQYRMYSTSWLSLFYSSILTAVHLLVLLNKIYSVWWRYQWGLGLEHTGNQKGIKQEAVKLLKVITQENHQNFFSSP